MYKRKTFDVFEVQADYGHGWETVTAELTRSEAKARLSEYRKNDTHAQILRIKTVREPIAGS